MSAITPAEADGSRPANSTNFEAGRIRPSGRDAAGRSAVPRTAIRGTARCRHCLGACACVAAAICGIEGWADTNACWLVGAVVFSASVIASFLAFQRQDQMAMLNRLADVNTQGMARIDRDWARLPLPSCDLPDELLDTDRDLDLFGYASLFHWICRARTPWGIAEVGKWIAFPAEPAVIGRRQAAIRELSTDPEYRQRLEAAGSFVESLGERSARFGAWINNPRDERGFGRRSGSPEL